MPAKRAIIFGVFLSLFFPCLLIAGGISYTVDFEGLDDQGALKSMRSLSQLTSLKKRPPASINALRYRAESDIPELLKVLHAHGYYEAKIKVRIEEAVHQVRVVVVINPGPVYKIGDFQIRLYCGTPEFPVDCIHADPQNIGITPGKPAQAEKILNAGQKLLQLLAECGYPLSKVDSREMIADGKNKTLTVKLGINTGPKAHFGTTSIEGLKKVKALFINQKTAWSAGKTYDSRAVENTQNALMDSGLFSSVLITHEETLNQDGQLPMKIELKETKHRSINLGVSYQTVFGPGITFGWQDRNISGMGRTLSFQGNFTRISHSGIGRYVHPDFLRVGQEMIWEAIAMHESLFAYHDRSYSLMNRFDRKIGDNIRLSIGAIGERLFVTNSVNNGNFWLVEVPFYVRFSNANNLLDPTKGITLEFTTTPSANINDAKKYYAIQKITESTYHPLTHSSSVVLAQQLTLGVIWSPHLSTVPMSKRFLGGSEDELRGYRYRTVSPLLDGTPEGGRSAIYWTFESRFRVTKSIGLVPFFDIGSVYKTQYPALDGKWYKSTGLGLRYFSFMGPFRFDVAFPLDRRKEIDPLYRVLVSIGQTF